MLLPIHVWGWPDDSSVVDNLATKNFFWSARMVFDEVCGIVKVCRPQDSDSRNMKARWRTCLGKWLRLNDPEKTTHQVS